MDNHNKTTDTKHLISELQQVVQTAIDEDSEIQKLKQRIDEAQELFDRWPKFYIDNDSRYPDENTIINIANNLGVGEVDTHYIQSSVSDDIVRTVNDRVESLGFCIEDICFTDEYAGGYCGLMPMFNLYGGSSKPENYRIGLDKFFFIETLLPTLRSDQIKELIESVKSNGMKALYNYYVPEIGVVDFHIGDKHYLDPEGAIGIVEEWIKEMQAIDEYVRVYKMLTSEEAMIERIRQKLIDLYNL